MTHEEKRLIEAAKKLKEHCENTECRDCVFCDGSCVCPLSDEAPEDWELPKGCETDE